MKTLAKRSAVLVLVPVTLWAIAALYFDFPIASLGLAAAIVYAVFVIVLLRITRARIQGLAVWAGTLLVILIWWFSLKPSPNRDWQSDVSQLAWAQVDGNHVTLHNVRNFDYTGASGVTPRWETRDLDIGKIDGLDLFVNYWGSPWIAHGILSFPFTNGTHLAMSIEARRTNAQEYSAVRGFFRQFGLIFIAADERDVIRVRTNVRHETVYLYRTRTRPEDAQRLFRQYLQWMNETRDRPQWYNALTNNCVSGVLAFLAREKIGGITRWDWRTVVNGPGDEMLYDLGDLAGDLSFPELKRRALINEAAQQATADDFSQAIRRNRPGFVFPPRSSPL